MKNDITLFIKTTALIKSIQENGEERLGTCFFIHYNNHVILATNKHLINYSNNISIFIEILDKETKISSEMILKLSSKNIIYNEIYDLCILEITNQIIEDDKFKVIFDSIDINDIAEDLSLFNKIQDVFMIGYPNAIRDTKNSYPIIRKGISSTLIGVDWDGNKEFLVDIYGVSGGSGSPVISECDNNYYLVGISYESFNYYKNTDIGKICIPTGISKVINSTVLLDMVFQHFS